MRKQAVVVALLAPMLAGPQLALAQVGRSAAPGQAVSAPGASSVEMRIVDEKGQPVRPESLPREAQANLERVRKAAESLAAGDGTGQRVKVTVNCSWPPLRCTITIQF